MAEEIIKSFDLREGGEYIGGAYLGLISVKYIPQVIFGIDLGQYLDIVVAVAYLALAYFARHQKDAHRMLMGAGLLVLLNGVFKIVAPNFSV